MKTLPFFLLPAFLCAAPPELKEWVYQTVKAPGYTIEGVVFSRDGRQPTLWDEKRDDPGACHFEYQLRIKTLDHLGKPLATKVIKGEESDSDSYLFGRGPLWTGFVDHERDFLGVWRFMETNGQIGDEIYALRYYNLKKANYITSNQFETYGAPGKYLQIDEPYPENWLSPSKKYLAVMLWHDHYDKTLLLQNYLSVIALPGYEASLYEKNQKEIPAVLRGKPAKIDSVKWLPGDRLEYTFSEAMPTGTDKILARAGKAVPKRKVPDPQIPFVVSAESLFQKKP